jgi:murein DD-endopeptidase MepM/ murein hydrolase activator NlpD
MRPVRALWRPQQWAPLAVSTAIALLAAGCSSDSTRFGNGLFGASKPVETTGSIPPGNVGQTSHAQPAPAQPRPQYQSYQSGPLPPPTRPATVAAAPQPQPVTYRPAAARTDVTGSVAPAPAPTPPPVIKASANAGGWSWNGGTAITVGPGETLDSIAHRYGVPASAIMQANGITVPSMVQPGQRLVIPRYDYAGDTTGSVGPRVAANAPKPQAASASRPAPAPAPTSGVHIVAPGDTLFKLSRIYRRPVTEIARANNIPPHAQLRLGDRIVIPGVPATPAPAVAQPRTTPQRVVAAEPPSTARIVTPANDNPPAGDDKTAATDGGSGAPGFRWPVRGRIIAGFGPKTTGQQNDGINLAVPEGTPIKAAEDGVVAYSGNELKGYGNLILVRHANGFVTAYAHASELLVKRGDKVKRGQVIAKSGQTGNVTSPQLHFEIRKGSTPVDPMQHLTNAG